MKPENDNLPFKNLNKNKMDELDSVEDEQYNSIFDKSN